MPHPERACELAVGSADGLVLFESVVACVVAERIAAGGGEVSTIDAAVIERHGLKPDEYDRIVSLLGREPNLTELGLFSVMWSEHCSYKSSRVHLKTLPTDGPRVLQGPGENAGAVDIGDGLAAVFKIESHNHPSFIEPYQGAATGVGGIIRDIFTMGARPIALLDALRFGPLDVPRNRRILQGVVSGIGGYGNSIGIPTIGGEVMFDETYSGNPLVNVFCLGIAKRDALVKGIAGGIGNPIYYVGAKTGRDGIHGATMASAEFDDKSAEKRPAVQVGDPFMEKLLLEACLEVMATDACVGVQDMGAAGLTLRHLGDRIARRRWRRDRRREGAAARNRHDAVRNHAVRIAGTHAAHREARPRGGSRTHLREVGSARRRDRRSDGGRAAADQAQRRARGRRAESRADRRSAGLSPAVCGAGGPRGAAADSARGAAGRCPRRPMRFMSLLGSPTVASKRWIYHAIRSHGAHQHDRAGRRRRGRGARERHDRARWRCRSTATAASSHSIRGRARNSRWPKPRATSRAPAPCRSVRPTA